MEVQFTIYGSVKGKDRPRVTVRGGYAMAYTPKETVNYENLVKYIYSQECNHYFDEKRPLYANIYAFYGIPKSTSKKKALEMENKLIRPMKKPDVDNISKIILDALNKIAYADDSQICRLCIGKYYSNRPRVEVEIGEL
jgi:Holliday junction resolvase RusA-like endonuclease